MMNKLPAYFSSLLLFFLFVLTPVQALAAPKLYFDPSTQTAVQNNEFTIQLKIDAEANQVIGSDVVVSYAGADLDVTAVTNGGYFPEFQFADNGSGRIELHGYVTSIYQTKTGAGTLATLKFKSTKSSGSSALTMTCSGNGNDTNMLNSTGQNILSCNSINQVSITYSSGASNTNTPTPTTAGGAATPTPTQASGNTTPTCTSLASSLTNTQGTPAPVTFTCSGADPDGYVNAAEFIFGDGTKQVVEKNVGGQGGSISTTHTFTSIGTFGASCRVRDNNTVYSSVPSGCKQTITIRPKPTNAPIGGSQIYTTPTPTPKGNTLTTVATTTAPIVSIISVTPLPTLALQPSPTLYPPEDAKDAAGSRFWWIAGGIASLLFAYLLLRKKSPPKPPPPAPMPPIIIQENTATPPEPPPSM